MARALFLSAIAVFLTNFAAHAAAPGSALEALNALPASYRNGVVWVSADNANPNPRSGTSPRATRAGAAGT